MGRPGRTRRARRRRVHRWIVLGSVLDTIPESFVLGLTVLQDGVSLLLLAGVALSNLPEGCRRSSGLKAAA